MQHTTTGRSAHGRRIVGAGRWSVGVWPAYRRGRSAVGVSQSQTGICLQTFFDPVCFTVIFTPELQGMWLHALTVLQTRESGHYIAREVGGNVLNRLQWPRICREISREIKIIVLKRQASEA